SGGGWPGTFRDVSLATDNIMDTISSDPAIDVARATVMGHSAGGHLAQWLASPHRVPKASPLPSAQKYRLVRAVSLAGVWDLRAAWTQRLAYVRVSKLMAGAPDRYPGRFDFNFWWLVVSEFSC